MRTLWMIAVLAAPAVLAACAGPRQVDATPPSVTYAFESRRDYDDIVQRADRHCYDNYRLRAYEIDRRDAGRGYEATFVCE
ncbi:MAG TPA: hypothetical protein VMM59_06335 [Thermohalobaculum sp.]|nr:hypothetical protein [Thermohalobaculum sp.]